MNIFITGGSGFVGRSVINALLANGNSIHALVNHRPLDHKDDRVKSYAGGLLDDAALDAAMQGCDAAIHLVGIIKEKPSQGITFDRIHYQGTTHVVDAARRAGIKRYLHMSALGAAANSSSDYQRTKFLAEEYVRASGLDWTIFRPSLIHGPGGEFTQMQQRWARGTAPPFFFMPYFGGGFLGRATPSKIQPVFVDDVARAFVDALSNPRTIGEMYPLGGPEQMTWPQMHRIAAGVIVGHPRPVLAIPVWKAKLLTHIVPSALLPFTRDQVVMSTQDNVCDLAKFESAFGWTARAFEQTLRAYVGK